MREMDLLHILDDLGDEEFKRFKWCLKREKMGNIEPIKESQLSNAERHEVVDLMVQKYEFAAAVKVIKRILMEIGRKDLVRKLPNISAGAEGLGMDLPSPVDAVEIEDTEMPVQRFNSLPNDSEMPMGMTSLLTVPLVADSIAEDSPVICRCLPQSLFHLLSMSSPVSHSSVKCTNHPRDENTPVRVKRQCSLAGIHVTTIEQNPESPRMFHLLYYSPSLKGQETDPHRYGISGQQPSQITVSLISQIDNKEKMLEEGFEFKTPAKPVSQSHVHPFNSGQSKEAFAHRRSSTPALKPVIHYCWQQSLFHSLSMSSPVSRSSVKRPNHPGDEKTPVRVKRQCSLGGAQVTTIEQDPESLRMIDATVIGLMDDGTPVNVKDEEYDGAKSDVKHDVQLRDTCEEDAQVTQYVVTLSPDSKEVYADALSNTSEVMLGPFPRESMASQLDDALIHQPSPQFEEPGPVITSITPPPTSTALTTLDTAAKDDEANSSTASNDACVTIKLHRVNLLEEMICQFKDPALLKHPLKYINIDEKGADVDGVSRDVYSAFWTEFMNHRAEGEDLRVPSLFLKWQEEEWKSIGRILLKGFQDHGYFPCRFAPVFTMALIFGENEVSDDMLFESLLLYVSQSDRDLITSALRGDLSDEDRDELLDLLHRFHVRASPTKDNLRGILLKVAHKQLIQEPRYAAEKMSLVASHLLKDTLVSPQDVLRMYDNKKPTTRKILKLLNASPTTDAENRSFRFLQQYIKGLDDTGLRRMLRFVTGSDVICVNKVEVQFTPVDGLARQPVAHICGPALELPSTYTSYPELRTEMDSILVPESCW